MPQVTSHTPGSFCWPELATTDAAGAKAFYCELFDWEAHEAPANYTMLRIGGQDIGALYALDAKERARGVAPHWNAYVTVASADQIAARATALGGKVLAEPFDVFDAGRMAILQDSAGAAFCVWEPRRHIGMKRVNEPNTLCWTELATHDPDAARTFYTQLFGWTAKADGSGPTAYTEFVNAGTPLAGMMKIQKEWGDVPAGWTPYFAVEGCDRKVSHAKELGAVIRVPPTDIPNVGRFAVIEDPQGAAFAIIEMREAA